MVEDYHKYSFQEALENDPIDAKFDLRERPRF